MKCGNKTFVLWKGDNVFKLKVNYKQEDWNYYAKIPLLPFIVIWTDGTNTKYLVSRNSENQNEIVLTNIDNGFSYKRSESAFLTNLNENKCKIIKSEMILS